MRFNTAEQAPAVTIGVKGKQILDSRYYLWGGVVNRNKNLEN